MPTALTISERDNQSKRTMQNRKIDCYFRFLDMSENDRLHVNGAMVRFI